MNKARRKEIEKALVLLDQFKEIIECVAYWEREAFDNLPESIQNSDKGTTMEDIANNLDDFVFQLEEMSENLQSIE